MAEGSLPSISKRQLDRTDRLFFDCCLTHGRQAYEAEAPAPALLDRRSAARMLRSARLLYRALERCRGAWPVPPFPLRETALADPSPPFWSRFDGFLRADGGVFFAELNHDRPGGHREAMAGNVRFRDRFLAALRRYAGPVGRAAFLIDPAHREELHIAHYYAGLLQELGWPCTVAGPLNLTVDGDRALAFGEPIDLLLRQFPTEFAHEVPAFAELMALHERGRLKLLNPPGSVAAQAKTSLAWLWEQALAGGGRLSRSEVEAVVETVPFTAAMTSPTLPADPATPGGERIPAALALLGRPELWVLKPALGRYSQGVTCGALVSPKLWGAAVAAAMAEPAYWVAQQYVPIKPQALMRWVDGQPEPVTGYVNWGLHFLSGRPAGWMARCSRTPVTDDAWFAPVSLKAGEDEHGDLDPAADRG